MDATTPLQELKDKVIAFRDERNWGQFHSVKNLAMGLSIEAAELQELFLWKKEDEIPGWLQSEAARQRVSEELADIMIFILYIAHTVGIDVTDAVTNKIRLNAQKYPVEKCRNSNKKYDDL